MSEKDEITDVYIKTFQRLRMDFEHFKNKGLGSGNYFTHAYDEPRSCVKYKPDLEFPFRGKVYQRECGLPGSNMARKAKQNERMKYWHKHGNVDILIVTSTQGAIDDLKRIGILA